MIQRQAFTPICGGTYAPFLGDIKTAGVLTNVQGARERERQRNLDDEVPVVFPFQLTIRPTRVSSGNAATCRVGTGCRRNQDVYNNKLNTSDNHNARSFFNGIHFKFLSEMA